MLSRVVEGDDRARGAIDHDDRREDEDGDVDDLGRRVVLWLCDHLVVQRGWDQERHWGTSEGSRNGKEPIKLVVDSESDDAGEGHNHRTRQVLAHLALARLLPVLEEPAFDDQVRRMDDQRVREEQVQTEEDFHYVGDGTLLWETARDEWLVERLVGSPGDQCKLPERNVHDGNDSHCQAKELVVVFLACSDFTNGQDDADAFVGVDRETDSVCPVRVDRLDTIHLRTVLRQVDSCVHEDNDHGDEDHDVAKDVSRCKHFDLADHNQRDVDSHTDGHPDPLIDDSAVAVVLVTRQAWDHATDAADLRRDEVDVGCAEAELTSNKDNLDEDAARLPKSPLAHIGEGAGTAAHVIVHL